MSAPPLPTNCVAHCLFEKRQHSKLSAGTSRLSKLGAVRAGLRLGAVTAKWERRWFVLCSNGELRWYGVDEIDQEERDNASCTIQNAFVSSSKASVIETIGDFNEELAPYYIFVGTATRRIILRTDSSAERDRWIVHLTTVAKAPRDPVSPASAPQIKTIMEDTEAIFANYQHWYVNAKGRGEMALSKESFRELCVQYDLISDSLTVDSIYNGLTAGVEVLSYERFHRYVKSLAKSLAESPSSFQGLRGTLGLLNGNEPLIRTEELVACTSEQFPISNGTLYLTDRHLIHQGWNVDAINVIPLGSIQRVEESATSGFLSLSDSLVLTGVDVYCIKSGCDVLSVPPLRDCLYRIQFSTLKDFIISSGEEREHGGRRALWLDLLTECSRAYALSRDLVAPSARSIPQFTALVLIRARAVFKASGHYSSDLFLCTLYGKGDSQARKVIDEFSSKAAAWPGIGQASPGAASSAAAPIVSIATTPVRPHAAPDAGRVTATRPTIAASNPQFRPKSSKEALNLRAIPRTNAPFRELKRAVACLVVVFCLMLSGNTGQQTCNGQASATSMWKLMLFTAAFFILRAAL